LYFFLSNRTKYDRRKLEIAIYIFLKNLAWVCAWKIFFGIFGGIFWGIMYCIMHCIMHRIMYCIMYCIMNRISEAFKDFEKRWVQTRCREILRI